MAYEEPGGKDRPFSPHPKLSMPTTKSHEVRLKGPKILGDLSRPAVYNGCTARLPKNNPVQTFQPQEVITYSGTRRSILLSCPDSLRKIITVMKHHTTLFNIAAHTVLKLSVTEAEQVYAYIEEVMNGDGLYEGFDKEGILEAYHDQHNPFHRQTWVELIAEAQTDMLSEPITSSWA